MRRFIVVLAAMAGAVLLFAPVASAGSAHFITSAFSAGRDGNTLTVNGKEAGLGDLSQVHIVVTATAACLNKGGNFPSAANKESVTAGADVPVQNGKANFSLSLTATFKPDCSPPMRVVFGDITVQDTTNGVTATLPGLY